MIKVLSGPIFLPSGSFLRSIEVDRISEDYFRLALPIIGEVIDPGASRQRGGTRLFRPNGRAVEVAGADRYVSRLCPRCVSRSVNRFNAVAFQDRVRHDRSADALFAFLLQVQRQALYVVAPLDIRVGKIIPMGRS